MRGNLSERENIVLKPSELTRCWSKMTWIMKWSVILVRKEITKKVLCWNALCHLTAGYIIASTRTYYIFICLLSMTVTVSRMNFLLVCFVMIHAGLQQLYCFPSFTEMWTDTTRCTRRWKLKDKTIFFVSLLIWRKRDFISSGNWTLCLKDTFEDHVVQTCLKYRMGKTGLISAYKIKCVSSWQHVWL